MRKIGRAGYANVVSTLALALALGGTGAYAAGTITSSDIKKNAVRSKHIKAGNVKSSDLRDGGVLTDDLGNGQVTSAKVADGSLGAADVAANTFQKPVRWAHVAPDGTILAQSGGISLAAHPFTGEYLLNLGTPTAAHGVWAIISGKNNDATNGAATAATCGPGGDTYANCNTPALANQVHVATHNAAGAKDDLYFYVFFLP